MAKEFDIHLNRQVTECDIIVYSLPYRDGLSAANRLILESCLESYTLQKMIAVQTGSSLVAHINDMIKLCKERLSIGIEFSQDASFQVSYASYPDDMVIHLGASDLNVLETSFYEAKNGMVLAVAPLTAYVTRPFSSVTMPILLGADVGEVKQSMIDALSSAVLHVSDVDTQKVDYLKTDAPIVVSAELANLCYSIYDTAETAIGIAQYVLGTELHHSFGFGNSALHIGAAVSGTNAQKFLAIESYAHILANAVDFAVKYITVDASAAVIDVGASSIVKRHRLLSEIDSDTLADLDGSTLEELDFVIL